MRKKPKGKRYHHLVLRTLHGVIYVKFIRDWQETRLSLNTKDWEEAVERRDAFFRGEGIPKRREPPVFRRSIRDRELRHISEQLIAESIVGRRW